MEHVVIVLIPSINIPNADTKLNALKVSTKIPTAKYEYEETINDIETFEDLRTKIAANNLYSEPHLCLFLVVSIAGDGTELIPTPHNTKVENWNETGNKNKFIICLGYDPATPIYASLPLMTDDEKEAVVNRYSFNIINFFSCPPDSTSKDEHDRKLAHVAALHCPKILIALFKKGDPSCFEPDKQGNTPIMYAALGGHCDAVRHLLRSKQTVVRGDGTIPTKGHGINDNKDTPLHFFAQKKNATANECRDMVKLFLPHGVNVYSRNSAYRTSVHEAVLFGNITTVEVFVKMENFILSALDEHRNTCLHLAVQQQDQKMIAALAFLGAPLYVVNCFSDFPLDVARSLPESEVKKEILSVLFQYYLNRGSNQEGVIVFKLVADCYAAIRDGELETVAAIIKEWKCRREETIRYPFLLNHAAIWAAARGRFSILKLLFLDPHIDFDFQTNDGSLLFTLCQYDSKYNYRTKLLERDNKEKNNPDIYRDVLNQCKYLGANVNEKTMDGTSCLHMAAFARNDIAVKFLLDNGAFVNVFTYPRIGFVSFSELHFAILGRNITIVNQLIQAGSQTDIELLCGLKMVDFIQFYGSPYIIAEANKSPFTCAAAGTQDDEIKDMFPNIVEITVKRFSVTENYEKNDIVCVLSHREKTKNCMGMVPYAERNSEIPKTFTFCISDDQKIYFRDFKVELISTQWKMGGCILTLDHTKGSIQESYDIKNQTKKIGSVTLSVCFKYVEPELYARHRSQGCHKSKNFNSFAYRLPLDGSTGQIMKQLGYTPKYPIAIVPGLASSSLNVLESPNSYWAQTRIWIDPLKFLTPTKLANSVLNVDPLEIIRTLVTGSLLSQNEFLKHILLAKDGISDPEGICVMPEEGLNGLSSITDVAGIVSSLSYVFKYLIEELENVGYTSKNLIGATYDWRLPLTELEKKHGYFTDLCKQCEKLYEANDQTPVVLMGHSMGVRTIQFFLQWVLKSDRGQPWIDQYIYSFCALGAPFLGSPKSLRSMVSGERMGLDILLSKKEGLKMCRGWASIGCLVPEQEDLYPDEVIRVKEGNSPVTPISMIGNSTEDFAALIGEKAHKEVYESFNAAEMLSKASERSKMFYKDFYQENPLYQSSIKDPPPVKNVWSFYGVNMDTEISYYYKKKADGTFKLDKKARKHSNSKIAGINPMGFKIDDKGIAYETRETFQQCINATRSGDGTVPYCSLSYAREWKKMVKRGDDIPLQNVQIREFESLEHREMLKDRQLTTCIIEFVCEIEKAIIPQ